MRLHPGQVPELPIVLPLLTDQTVPAVAAFATPHAASPVRWRERHAARAVVFRAGRVALLYARAHNYHKLPGGGIEAGESTVQALARELLEETGCSVTNVREVARITEERSHTYHLRQHSTCFAADQVGEIGQPVFTAKELQEEFEVVWAESLPAAIDMVAQDRPITYEGHFIQARDRALLEAVLRVTTS